MIRAPQDQWDTLIPGAHAGYLSWEGYEQNQKRLHESAHRRSEPTGAEAHRVRVQHFFRDSWSVVDD